MSWWVYLVDTTAKPWCSYGTPKDQFKPEYEGDEPCGKPCYPKVEVVRHSDGGTYVLGGTDEAELNVTYNYSPFYYRALDNEKGLESLDGQKAKDVLQKLVSAVDALGTKRDKDYWSATPGNAGYALSILAAWAKQHPEAVFKVS